MCFFHDGQCKKLYDIGLFQHDGVFFSLAVLFPLYLLTEARGDGEEKFFPCTGSCLLLSGGALVSVCNYTFSSDAGTAAIL